MDQGAEKEERNEIEMPKKILREMSFSEILQRKLDKERKRREQNMALFRAEQKRQGKKPNEPIDLMAMVMGSGKKKK